MSDLVVDSAAITEVARRLRDMVDEIDAIDADVVLRRVAETLPGSVVGGEAEVVASSWSRSTDDVVSRQRATAAGMDDAAAEFASTDEGLADQADGVAGSAAS